MGGSLLAAVAALAAPVAASAEGPLPSGRAATTLRAATGTVLPPAFTPIVAARPRPGGYYVGSTVQGRQVTLDVGRTGRRIPSVSWQFDCAGQVAQSSAQNVAIKRTSTGYAFTAKTTGILYTGSALFDPSGQVTGNGRFLANGRTVQGSFNYTSSTCGTTPDGIRYTARLR